MPLDAFSPSSSSARRRNRLFRLVRSARTSGLRGDRTGRLLGGDARYAARHVGRRASALQEQSPTSILRAQLRSFASRCGRTPLISRMLDFGAEGIIAPMINGEAEARAYVQAAKYPPVGERSIGAHRAGMLARVPDQKLYIADANVGTITFAMIETRAAMDDLEIIAAMPGIELAVRRPLRPVLQPVQWRLDGFTFGRCRGRAGEGAESLRAPQENSGPVLPRCRSRRRQGEIGLSFSRGRKRHRVPARRYGRAVEGAWFSPLNYFCPHSEEVGSPGSMAKMRSSTAPASFTTSVAPTSMIR